MKGIIVEVVRVSMCRFRFKFYQAVVQRCREKYVNIEEIKEHLQKVINT